MVSCRESGSEQLTSTLPVAGFVDDLTLGSLSDVVAADLDYLNSIQDDTGLRINASKSEIISRGSKPRTAQFEGFILVAPEEAKLLGAPVLLVRRSTTLKTVASISTPQSAVCLCCRHTMHCVACNGEGGHPGVEGAIRPA